MRVPSSGCPSPSGAAHLLTAKPDKVAQAVYPAVILELQEGHLFALDAAYDVAVSLGRLGVAAKHHGLAAVGGHDDGLVIGDDPEQLDGENLDHVFDVQHVPPAHHLGADPVD